MVVWVFVCHHAKNDLIHRKLAVDSALVIISISEIPAQARPGQAITIFTQNKEREIICPVNLCIVDIGSC